MNVSIEDISKCKKLIRVVLDPADLKDQFDKVGLEVVKHASLPGFRPGKAPRDRVLKAFESRIADEVKSEALKDSYGKALAQHKLRPVASPDIEDVEFGRDTGLRYHATVEVEDAFDLPEYVGLVVTRETRQVTAADVDRAVEMLRERGASYQTVNRAVQSGDFVVVNYTGTCEGKPITEFNATARGLTEQSKYWLHIQPDQFIPGFTDQLIGAAAGEKRTVTIAFPAEFVITEVAGKQGVYAVEILEVKEKVLPALDEAFAKSLGAESVEKLKEGVQRDLENELKFKLKRQVQDQLVKRLLAQVNCELPECLVQQQTRSVVYDIVRANQQRGVRKEAIDEQKDEIYSFANSSARERVKATLILNRIAEKENIKVTQEELSRRVLVLAAQNNIKPEKLAKELREGGGLNDLLQQTLGAKVLDFIEGKAQIQDVPPAD